jgi:hypothetical protein
MESLNNVKNAEMTPVETNAPEADSLVSLDEILAELESIEGDDFVSSAARRCVSRCFNRC